MFRYEKELKAFQLEILTEYTKFYNTCEQLLQDLAVSEDIKQLIKPESPAKGKEGWSSANVRQALARKLNKSTADVFLQNVEAMNEVIEELMRDFPSDEGTVCHSLPDWKRCFLTVNRSRPPENKPRKS